MVTVVNLKHEPDAVANGAVLIDRRTRWGNPFVVGRDGTREQVIARYRAGLWRRIRADEVPLAELAASNPAAWLAIVPRDRVTAWCSRARRPGRPPSSPPAADRKARGQRSFPRPGDDRPLPGKRTIRGEPRWPPATSSAPSTKTG